MQVVGEWTQDGGYFSLADIFPNTNFGFNKRHFRVGTNLVSQRRTQSLHILVNSVTNVSMVLVESVRVFEWQLDFRFRWVDHSASSANLGEPQLHVRHYNLAAFYFQAVCFWSCPLLTTVTPYRCRPTWTGVRSSTVTGQDWWECSFEMQVFVTSASTYIFCWNVLLSNVLRNCRKRIWLRRHLRQASNESRWLTSLSRTSSNTPQFSSDISILAQTSGDFT